jgi:GH24 family phage-related lysozyme (muramidase)
MANEHMTLSPAGARFTAGWEGVVLHPYNDGADPPNATIGIGHLIHYGPVTSADTRAWRSFTLEDAYQLLRQDVAEVERQIRARITRPLNQNEWDALVDVVINCGPGILDAGVAEAINAGELRRATEIWDQWVHAGGIVLEGLVRRRAGDSALFLSTPAPYENPQETRWEREYDQLRHGKGWAAAGRRRALVRAMTRRRKEIWKLANAEPDGWGKLNRASRYRALLARTGG